MPVKPTFRAEICGRTPSQETVEALAQELLDTRFQRATGPRA